MSFAAGTIYPALPVVNRGQPVFPGYCEKRGELVYGNGNAAVIRGLSDISKNDVYYEHSTTVTCAKYSPSGFYIASGDAAGNVRIWDTTQREHPLKLEIRALSGAVSDIAWSGDSQRILVVGDGKERFGSVFMWDAGSSVGEISGHTAAVLSGDIRQQRPFRIATGGNDLQTNWFEGPPFKFKYSIRDHQRMITCVRFAPTGEYFATAGTDKKIAVYEGKTGQKVTEWSSHKGGVYGLAWSPDGKMLASVSADKTACLWEIPTGNLLAEKKFGGAKPQVRDQQLGLVWTKEAVIAVNLEGEMTYLSPDPAKFGGEPIKIVNGHSKAIGAVAVHDGKLYSGSYEGKIVSWDIATTENEGFTGTGHTNKIAHICIQGDKLVSGGMDNTVCIRPLADLAANATPVKFDDPIVGIACGKEAIVVASLTEAAVIVNNQKVFVQKLPYLASCLSLSPDEKEVVIGTKGAKEFHAYAFDGAKLEETAVVKEPFRGELTCIKYSPDGKYIATADTSRNIYVWDAATKTLKIEGWQFHTSRIQSLAWSADNVHLASGGVDGCLFVWNVNTPATRIAIKNIHPAGINAVAWIDEATVISAGQDCIMKTWKLTY